jgi:hypothetical protein
MPISTAKKNDASMTRNLYRLMHCMPESGEESWGYFDSDKEAIASFVSKFKDRERKRRNDAKKYKRPLYNGTKWGWIIQRLGYIKPGVVISDVNIPWKTIYTIESRDDFW